MNFNQVVLGGNLTRDPEVRYTPSGTACVKFGLAINRRWKDEKGETQERVAFVDVTIWGKRGEAFAKYHRKGAPAFVVGRLDLEAWIDKATGDKRQKLVVTADEWQFCGAAREHQGSLAPESLPAIAPVGADGFDGEGSLR